MLPWIQVEKRFLIAQAAALAERLRVSRHAAIGLMCDFWAWSADFGVARGEDLYVVGPEAVARIEAAAGWRGKRGALAAAMVAFELVEPAGDDYRVCGGDRYVKAMAKLERDAERQQERRRRRGGAEAEKDEAQEAPASERRPRDRRGVESRDGRSETSEEAHTQKSVCEAESPSDIRATVAGTVGAEPPPAPRPSGGPSARPSSGPSDGRSRGQEVDPEAFYDACLKDRAGLTDVPDQKWSRARVQKALSGPLGEVGGPVLSEAYGLFLADRSKAGKAPPWPMWIFAQDYGQYVDEVLSAPRAKADPAEQPDTPAGRAWAKFLEQLGDERAYARSWLARLAPVALEGGEITLGVPDRYMAAWVGDHYEQLIRDGGLTPKFVVATEAGGEAA